MKSLKMLFISVALTILTVNSAAATERNMGFLGDTYFAKQYLTDKGIPFKDRVFNYNGDLNPAVVIDVGDEEWKNIFKDYIALKNGLAAMTCPRLPRQTKIFTFKDLKDLNSLGFYVVNDVASAELEDAYEYNDWGVNLGILGDDGKGGKDHITYLPKGVHYPPLCKFHNTTIPRKDEVVHTSTVND